LWRREGATKKRVAKHSSYPGSGGALKRRLEEEVEKKKLLHGELKKNKHIKMRKIQEA